MRLALNPRARRLLRRVPRTTVYTVLELILLSLLAIQCARLAWALVTPVGPVGEWRSAAFRAAPVSTALLGSFDPFFRLGGNAPAAVTSLDLKLFGVSENRGSGRGSAIIQTPDGLQHSFAVGDEIVPGAKLAAVSFDSVTIDRGGTMEQLFLDQSQPATMVAPAGAPTPLVAPQPAPVAVPAPPIATGDIQFQPRMDGGRMTGVVVNPQGSGTFFARTGLQPNDVIVSVDGQPVAGPDQLQSIAGRVGSGGDVTLTVERGGTPTTVKVRGGR